MLWPMEAVQNHSEASPDFAGALAAFAADAAASSGDDLADDVTILSYESAVRAQAGFDLVEAALPEESDPDEASRTEKKSASITIRMSRAECAQLRKRADAASLTVSAYMRSCILEAETLRAQVKEALAELRAAAPDEGRTSSRATRRWWQLGGRSN